MSRFNKLEELKKTLAGQPKSEKPTKAQPKKEPSFDWKEELKKDEAALEDLKEEIAEDKKQIEDMED